MVGVNSEEGIDGGNATDKSGQRRLKQRDHVASMLLEEEINGVIDGRNRHGG